MKFDGLLPIGSVVLLTNSTKRVMIIGYCQKAQKDGKIWDYAGCVFPEGYLSADKTFLFNEDQLDRVFSIGYQDEEQLAFKEKIEKVREELKGQNKESL